MLHAILVAGLLGGQLSAPVGGATACAQAISSGLSASAAELCLGEEQVRQAMVAKDARERTRLFEAAVDHYNRAVSLAGEAQAKSRALNALAETYDAKHSNLLDLMEQTLRALVAVEPNNLTNVFRLARIQEDQKLIGLAEETLLSARREHPDVIEPYTMLAQFYSRRAVALRQETGPPEAGAPSESDRDENGVYRVGNGLPAPARLDVARYPPEAMAVGVSGVVIAEIVVDEQGTVSDAKILRSVPLLDDAALAAVRNWRYTPSMVNGQPVPVKLTVTVNFSLPPSSQPERR